jgi:hypothetical protein
MFVESQRGVVTSDLGFEVADLGVRHLTYREGDHVVQFDKDIGARSARYYIRDTPRWQAPFQDEIISAEKAAEIRARVVDALRFRGYSFHTDMDDG